jgi:tRNA modification GTPase
VEKIGIGLSLKHLETAEAVVAVLDGGTPVTSEDESVLAAVRDKKGLIVINKIDLPQEVDIDRVKKAAPGKTLIPISATKGEGLSEFREALRALLIIDSSAEPPMVITNARHKAALERAEQSLRRAVAALQAASPPEFVAVDLEETRESIEEIIGVITNDDVLERIFSKFCIGK